MENESKQNIKLVNQEVSEDSVAQDIKKFKEFGKGVIDKFGTKLPTFKTKVFSSLSSIKLPTEKFSSQKVVKIFGAFFLIIFGLAMTFSFLKLIKNNFLENKKTEVEISITPTPTPVSYQPYLPSFYAKDTEVLKLEEDANLLEKEIVGSQLEEKQLLPPNLDFNIKF